MLLINISLYALILVGTQKINNANTLNYTNGAKEMSKASGLGDNESALEDNEDWEVCVDTTLFDKIPSMKQGEFKTHYKDVNTSLKDMSTPERQEFIFQMIRNPALSSVVLELPTSPHIPLSLWRTIYEQVQEQHIAISNGWVSNMLQEKSNAYYYVITQQPKAEEVMKTAEQVQDHDWDISTFLGELLHSAFFAKNDEETDRALAGQDTEES